MWFKVQHANDEPFTIALDTTLKRVEEEHEYLKSLGYELVYYSCYDEINRGKRWLWKREQFTIMTSLFN